MSLDMGPRELWSGVSDTNQDSGCKHVVHYHVSQFLEAKIRQVL